MKVIKSVFFSIKPILIKLFNPGKIDCVINQRRWGRGFTVVVSKGSHISIGARNNFRNYFQIRAVHGGKIIIGDDCFCNTNVSITSLDNVKIGNRVKLANNVVIVDHDHDYISGNIGYQSKPVVIEDDVWIGANVVILKGVTIGKGAVVAAGAVVTNSIPSCCVAGGVPAKIIKSYES